MQKRTRKQRFSRALRRDEGFTIIETMVALGVILASVVALAIRQEGHGAPVRSLAFTPDGTQAYVTSSLDDPHGVSIIDVATDRVIDSFNAGSGPFAVAFASVCSCECEWPWACG